MIDIEKNKAEFKAIVNSTIHRDGINELMNWLDTTDFYTAPASAKYHGNEPGGLCAHSLGVYNCLKVMQRDESDETIAIAALFHDLCKVNFYKVSTRNTKDESGKWIQVPFYEYRQDDLIPLGHGEKSMFIIMQYMKLSPEEACAIRHHMGGYYTKNPGEDQALGQALGLYQLVLKLQTADSQSAFWYHM